MTDLEAIGMDPRESFKIYPRIDQQFRTKGSLNFDIIRTKIYKERPQPPRHDCMVYTIYLLIGLMTGLLTVCIAGAEQGFSKLKINIVNDIIGGSENNMFMAWSFFSIFGTGLAFCAAVLVVYVAPQAEASGIPELMGYLNGVNYSNYFGLKSMVVKVFAIIMVGVAGLCVGRVGTFAYLGAMIGMGCIYLPISGLTFFHTDARKREFVSAGMACGIAAGFGSPIGGTLFSYEIS